MMQTPMCEKRNDNHWQGEEQMSFKDAISMVFRPIQETEVILFHVFVKMHSELRKSKSTTSSNRFWNICSLSAESALFQAAPSVRYWVEVSLPDLLTLHDMSAPAASRGLLTSLSFMKPMHPVKGTSQTQSEGRAWKQSLYYLSLIYASTHKPDWRSRAC